MASVERNEDIAATHTVDLVAPTTTTNKVESETVSRGTIDCTTAAASTLIVMERIGATINEVVPVEQDQPPRVPYENGYGHFYFHEFFKNPKKPRKDGTFRDMKSWEQGSNGNPVPELNGFTRSGSFPFFKLPDIIRKKIYQLLLGPLYSYSQSLGTRYILFHLHSEYRPGVPWKLVAWPEREDIPKGTWRTRKDVDWLFLAWLRNVSNVSTIFRNELGAVLWERTGLFLGFQFVWVGLPRFLKQRPAICDGLRSLFIEIYPDDDYLWGSDSTGRKFAKCFKKWSRKLSKRLLSLERVTFEITMEQEDIEKFKHKVFPALGSTRSWNVKYDFTIKMNLSDGENDNYWDSEMRARQSAEVQQYLIELMLPNTLRPKAAESEMDIYLKARPKSGSTQARSISPAPSYFTVDDIH